MFEALLSEKAASAIQEIYGVDLAAAEIQIQKTNKDIEGDFTIVVFPLVRKLRQAPEVIGKSVGEYLLQAIPQIKSFQVIKGFLNVSFSDTEWMRFFYTAMAKQDFGFVNSDFSSKYVIEFSSPNTNKPLHLGHIRNNLLGDSVARILEAAGNEVTRVNLVNDRGIHISKSMLAWKLWGNGETPQSAAVKGDHLVGKYYVLFDQHVKKQVSELIQHGLTPDEAENQSTLMLQAREMLRKWEAGDEDTRALWKMMNGWVYEGFDDTYDSLGIQFDKVYYESETYLTGREIVMEGLTRGIFLQKEDESVWVDLTGEGLDEKLLLRSDGTSVYITQDIGTAVLRNKELDAGNLVYVVGNEQNYHFKVLQLILKKLGYDWADRIYHLSYGMVELPEGRMKSREGKVVDADDLLEEMFSDAEKLTNELGKASGLSANEAEKLYHMVGIAALKYFILKVDPAKNMLFNPAESIDFNGNTGPFIQYTHARICSLLQKADYSKQEATGPIPAALLDIEKEIIRNIYEFPKLIQNAAYEFSPALIANFAYELAKLYNQFYQEIPVIKENDENKRRFRLDFSSLTADILKRSLLLLGIESPERM